MTSPLPFTTALAFLCAWPVALFGTGRAHAQSKTAPAPKSCSVSAAKPTDADTLLAKHAYKEAEAAYRALLSRDAASQDAHLGLVRSFIGENKVKEAQTEAAAMLASQPKSALAEIAASEADYRAADVVSSYNHAVAAATDDPCEGRAAFALARLFTLNGNYAHAASFYAQAHSLRPFDELIRRNWINSLPRQQRQAELARYLEGENALSTGAKKDYDRELAELKAYKPGECRVVSKADSATEKMQPMYGDDSRPEVYGLDAFFNGKKRRVQIDTGASGILLSEKAARDLDLTPESKAMVGGIGDEGASESYLTHVQSIRIGDVEISDCTVEVARASKLEVDGLIGMDVFSRWAVTLDYIDDQVRLTPLPPRPATGAASQPNAQQDSRPTPSGTAEADSDTQYDLYVPPQMKDWLPFIRIDHEILLQSRIKDGPVHYVIMDTGAGLSNLSLNFAREAGRLHDGSEMTITGLSGEVKKVYNSDRITLRVENIILPTRFYYTYDMTSISHDSGFEISGLLGLPTLQRFTITIDYRDNRLKVEYDPSKDRQRF